MTRTLLIADLHLTSGKTDKTNLFIKFCHEKAIEADQLFILGDLFNTTFLVVVFLATVFFLVAFLTVVLLIITAFSGTSPCIP
jgi:3-deoxy-D-manno-octulosonate 8-phosphate phosphatase KdsC-like HAD superfamily phosphatase